MHRGGSSLDSRYRFPCAAANVEVCDFSHEVPRTSTAEVRATLAVRRSRNLSRAMAVPAMLEHGRDARGTKFSRLTKNLGGPRCARAASLVHCIFHSTGF